ncbi:SH3 domain-containing protein [Wolinella succinogenes]|uniref:SH3 domain-containing protein n=1 Tax=Wolinella succinogenes TaxID=844 RepID=UPI001695ABF9|nr:SH3 domain-containing protein [Wolinella succinogenes]NLU34753.1 SH3 domain-containing protein [Wolinella succinogenes]
MNEAIYKILRFFKIYSLPFLTVVLAFGIYYVIFEVTHALKKKEEANLSDRDKIALIEEDKNPEAPPLVPIEIPQPEAPLPEVPLAPNLSEERDSSASSTKTLLYSVNTEVLNIRENPSTTAPITAKKERGEVVEASEVRGDWVKIKEGWAYLKLLTPLP